MNREEDFGPPFDARIIEFADDSLASGEIPRPCFEYAAVSTGSVMGTLTYDSSIKVDFEDRLLLHLQMVISAKLRRDESFLFTWTKPDEDGGGRTSVWIDRRVPLVFDYPSNAVATISRQWIDELTATTYRPNGMQVVAEPNAESVHASASAVSG